MLGPFTLNPIIRGLASALGLLIYFFNLKGQTTCFLSFFKKNKNSTNNMLSITDDEKR
jgi:hypothetical protein